MTFTRKIELVHTKYDGVSGFGLTIGPIVGKEEASFPLNKEELVEVIKFFKSVESSFLPTLEVLPRDGYRLSKFSTGI